MGLLPRDNQEQIVFAYKLYTRTDDAGIKLSAGFKKTYCQPVEIEFLGVWWGFAACRIFVLVQL